jgi:hypothetical protein
MSTITQTTPKRNTDDKQQTVTPINEERKRKYIETDK